ncbi:hypothetical protein AA18889_2448 [Acetobacter senegalensis DSM 18889]|nr:hypothetical protein AA18889_2448 [Acetobacter senegalensis DSM 18889]
MVAGETALLDIYAHPNRGDRGMVVSRWREVLGVATTACAS